MSTVNLTLYDDHKQVVQSYKKYYCYGPLGDPTTPWTFCRASPTSPPNKEYLKWLQQSPLAEYYQGDIIKKLSYKKELGTAFVKKKKKIFFFINYFFCPLSPFFFFKKKKKKKNYLVVFFFFFFLKPFFS